LFYFYIMRSATMCEEYSVKSSEKGRKEMEKRKHGDNRIETKGSDKEKEEKARERMKKKNEEELGGEEKCEG
jgi:hypothetical protein